MLAAFLKLESAERADHELAFRIMGATLKQFDLIDARRGLTYLMYHGIGTRRDANASVRMALPLVRAGDPAACRFAIDAAPDTFKSAATKVPLEKLGKSPPAGPIRVGGVISLLEESVVQLNGSKQEFTLPETSDRMQEGRYIDMWGLVVNGAFQPMLAEVPEPEASFKWKVNGQTYGGRWQLHNVRVTVTNSGVQPIKRVQFHVSCYVNGSWVGNRSQLALVTDIQPGKSKTIDVDFESYNYYYRGVANPKASCEVDEVEW